MTAIKDAIVSLSGVLLTATVVPTSLFATLLMVRAIAYLWYVGLNRRALPVVVNDINSRHGLVTESDLVSHSPPDESLLDLPYLLRDYVAADPPLSRQLAPGVATAVSPEIPWAAPGAPQSGWTAALINLMLPQKQAAYNIFVTRHNWASSRLTASVEVVKSPGQRMVASKTFTAATTTELVALVGGFCMESVQLQPAILRRTPRWEQWGSRGAYSLFRQAVLCQEAGDGEAAGRNYELATRMVPGNVKLGLHRASMYELEGSFEHAALLYDAMHNLWRENIEVAYRAAAVKVNLAQALLDEQHRGACEMVALYRALRFLDEAQTMLGVMASGLRHRNVLLRWLATWLPGKRDIGERRYWMSWLRRDDSDQPLGLLRRSKGYEYTKTCQVALEANRLLKVIVQSEIASRPAGARDGAKIDADHFDMNASVHTTLAVIRKKRAGWLARWTAASYFSRAAMAADLVAPTDWQMIERQWRRRRALGWPTVTGGSGSWRECCEDIAIGEIARVLRNPCNQANPDLLQTDPDMRRLRHALKGELVRTLMGPALDNGPVRDTESVQDRGPVHERVPAQHGEPVQRHEATVAM